MYGTGTEYLSLHFPGALHTYICLCVYVCAMYIDVFCQLPSHIRGDFVNAIRNQRLIIIIITIFSDGVKNRFYISIQSLCCSYSFWFMWQMSMWRWENERGKFGKHILYVSIQSVRCVSVFTHFFSSFQIALRFKQQYAAVQFITGKVVKTWKRFRTVCAKCNNIE